MISGSTRPRGLPRSTCCQTFPGDGITAYLSNLRALEQARQDRRARMAQDDEALRPDGGQVTVGEIERIVIWTGSKSKADGPLTHRRAGVNCVTDKSAPIAVLLGGGDVANADEPTGRLLLDSNIWIKEVGLMSQRSSTLRLYMREHRKRLVVPEVVQAEAARHLAWRMRSEAAAARNAHERLVRILGTLSEWQIPSDEEITAHADRLARGKDVPAEYVALQPDTALRGARRCIAQRAPAHRKRAFVDCLIWEEVMNLLDSHDLCFVTNDGDFFDDNARSHKLRRSLEEEAAARTYALRVERDLGPILDEFRREYTIDTQILLDFVNSRGAALTQAAESLGFAAEGPPTVSYKAFATESAGEVEVRFTSVQPFGDTTERGWSTDGLRIEARGLYKTRTGTLEEVSMDLERLTYVDDGGNRRAVPGSTIYARLDPIYLGTRPITSDRRELIDSGEPLA